MTRAEYEAMSEADRVAYRDRRVDEIMRDKRLLDFSRKRAVPASDVPVVALEESVDLLRQILAEVKAIHALLESWSD